MSVPATWSGRRTLLHFQAVDHDATVWVNGEEVARHRGGFTPFTADLGDVGGQDVSIVVRARDDVTSIQPRGKQSVDRRSSGCLYTRTTGIWQTVWLEPVPAVALQRTRITARVGAGQFVVEQPLTANPAGWTVRATLDDPGATAVTAETPADDDFTPTLVLPLPAHRRRLWSPADPHLYAIVVELVDGSGGVVDSVRTYAGLRSITRHGRRLLLNGEPVFQRLVLDQGYWPDGILTAPSDAHLIADIELGMAAGFNGARVHERIAEERFLYHADRLGYLVWAEFPDWCSDAGPRGETAALPPTYITQWLEAVERDVSHPSIVGWCPLNETHGLRGDGITQLDDVTAALVLATHLADPTRPVLDASGHAHRVAASDIYDSHDYDQDAESFADRHSRIGEGAAFVNQSARGTMSIEYGGQPYFVSEFGGIWWNPRVAAGDDSWGYGARPASAEEFRRRFEELCDVLLSNPEMFGYCYTQLTDVEQEQNGLFTADRKPKLDPAEMRRIQGRQAAYEAG